MITIYLARHGQTEENISRIFQGHLPGHLTEEGKQQAVELGKRLRDILLDAILSSDLQRVIDTVRLAVGDRNLPWQTTPLLREMDWGSWTGFPLDSVGRLMLKHVKCFTNVLENVWNISGSITKENAYW